MPTRRKAQNDREIAKILTLYEVADMDFYELDDKLDSIVEDFPHVKGLHAALVQMLVRALQKEG